MSRDSVLFLDEDLELFEGGVQGAADAPILTHDPSFTHWSNEEDYKLIV